MYKNLRKLIHLIIDSYSDLFFISAFILFSTWLMFSTFSYTNGSMQVGAKAWSDFASTIPLIRSFSFGANFPPEYPIFPGEPIHYHFLFYFLVGLLEKIGLRIDFALNIPSIIGFSSLLFMVYLFSKKLFKDRKVGLLSVLFFLFNGSLSFIEFFKAHPTVTNTVKNITSSNTFSSFGPYDGKIVSAFWNLNIYTNQRHLAFAFFLSLAIIFIFIKPVLFDKKNKLLTLIILGIALGLFFFFHLAVLLCTVVVIILLSIFFKDLRIPGLIILAIGGLICLPQYLYLQSGASSFSPFLSIGYLAPQKLTVFSFLHYWFFNLGLHVVLIPLGFVFAPKKLKKLFLAFFAIFIIGNTIQFSPEAAANHKFFNYFMLIGVMFSAFALMHLWKTNYLKPLVIVLIFFLIFSGIIDFFPVYNDGKATLADYPINQEANWIRKNTPKNSVFLNSQYLYNPASVAGRKIFLGWPYFSWSAGYDTNARDELRKKLLSGSDLKNFCTETTKHHINYTEISKNSELDVNDAFFEKNFVKEYENSSGSFKFYKIDCKK